MSGLIRPNWPSPPNVKSLITTCFSPDPNSNAYPPYGEFNLAFHVDDKPSRVEGNRQLLTQYAGLPSEPYWLNQVHSNKVELVDKKSCDASDAAYTNKVNQVCVIMTADCLPILLTTEDGKEIAAIHAGWRGLLKGIIENTVSHFASKKISAYLGPAISQKNYQVGEEVYQEFIDDNQTAKSAFIIDPQDKNKFKMDIYTLAKQRLKNLQVHQVYGGDYCTYDESRFYSYRQACHQGDGRTGRMASLIWINK